MRCNYCKTPYERVSYNIGTNAVGVLTKEGIVFAVEKGVSIPDFSAKSNKVWKIDKFLMCAASGPYVEIPKVVEYACSQYDCTEPNRCFARNLYFHGLVEKSNVSLLLAGLTVGIKSDFWCVTKNGASKCDTYFAIGPRAECANKFLKKNYKKNLTLDKGLDLALLTMQETLGNMFNSYNVELAQFTKCDLINVQSHMDIERLLKK
ncbi:proteasome subunit alpha type-5-like [Teleopsis dalmanni]|uniref:proteasome subunit alpha type-5-like n=1 Tax=Teleopsis dalmanni TaxID=139649 RepID=UPI0018CEC6DF|nr:proteasome subunit alpha type-5-like [Teleopsis dalmanni]